VQGEKAKKPLEVSERHTPRALSKNLRLPAVCLRKHTLIATIFYPNWQQLCSLLGLRQSLP
jgi:hypothetical protein